MDGFSNSAARSNSGDMFAPLIDGIRQELNKVSRAVGKAYTESVLVELEQVRQQIAQIDERVADLVTLRHEDGDLKYVIEGSATAHSMEYGTPTQAPQGLLRSAAARSAQSLPLRIKGAFRL